MKAVAPGKLILSGEHAVVYGKPAIAMAIDRSATFELTPQAGDRISFDLSDGAVDNSFTLMALRDLKRRVEKKYHEFLNGDIGIGYVLAAPADLFRFAFINTLDGLHRKLDSGLVLKLRSSIPMGCGMGSSAATVLSEIRAMGHYLRVDFKPEWYYEYSLEAEKLQHGKPSGVDSYISLYGGCARFEQGKATSIALPRMKMFMVQTGVPESTTGECVMEVERRFRDSAIWSEFEDVTNAFEDAIRHNNVQKLHWLVRENNRLLNAIGVVPPRVQQFISDIEAWGGSAKVCGAGAVVGNKGGIVLVISDQQPSELCARYGYTVSPVRGDPLGTRII
ncbi:MAG: mevalonate kinase [Pontiellaceae bacterium]|nr:mevalonate kinase [Pontiellaceae bacterium]MBN2783935.1 mevalonate kinase [Pontiellaceae bacterium]